MQVGNLSIFWSHSYYSVQLQEDPHLFSNCSLHLVMIFPLRLLPLTVTIRKAQTFPLSHHLDFLR